MSTVIYASLQTFNQLITAGIAITAFSLLLYVLTFNLRNRVARSFATILACVTIVFVGEALGSTVTISAEIEFWLRFQWVGIIFLPAAYFHAADALLETTGRPSRGRRRLVIRLAYMVSIVFLVMLPTPLLIGPYVQAVEPAPHLSQATLTWLFSLFYGGVILWAGINLWRAFQRTYTRTSRRRFLYLMAGATAPALGSFPYLVFVAPLAVNHPWFFWIAVVISNLLVTVLLVMMAYAVSFFGVDWPDRVVKSRLFKWLMRGPVTASTVLTITTLVRRSGERYGLSYNAAVPILMVATILIFQLGITLMAPIWERWLFYGEDQEDLRAIQDLENRLLTTGDLRQFLESILAAVCDRLQSPSAFIAGLGENGLEMVVTIGDRNRLESVMLSQELLEVVSENGEEQGLFTWGPYWLIPLFGEEGEQRQLFGLMGVIRNNMQSLGNEQTDALNLLAQRASMALRDRQIQRQVLSRLQDLTPEVEIIQRLRAASRYGGSYILTDPEVPLEQAKVTKYIKDALSHYWGGPKLTESPLMGLKVVQRSIEGGENPANALREILRQAIEQVKPQGDRRFTAEWILYNILEMKFMEGRKVREIAMRLAMSEADFYRKQRIAIEEIAKIILEMEKDVLAEEIEISNNHQINIKKEKVY